MRIAHYAVNETSIDEYCSELFMCAHILAAAWGRFTVENGDHHEAPVIHALGIANSGQRKSAVNDRLCAPALAFEEKLKANHRDESGPFSKQLISSVPKSHSKKILADANFDSPDSIMEAVRIAKRWDGFYKNLQQQTGTPPNINVTDVTPYKLAKLMQDNGNTQLMASAEGGGFEKLLHHKDIELALKSYDQEPYTYASAKGQIGLGHPTLNIAVFGQFIVALNLFTSPRLCNRGNTARIMPSVNPDQQPVIYNDLRGDEDAVYKNKITRLLENFFTRDSGAERYGIKIDKDASNAICSFRAEMDAWDHGLAHLRSWVAKLHGQALRLALAIQIHVTDLLPQRKSTWASILREIP